MWSSFHFISTTYFCSIQYYATSSNLIAVLIFSRTALECFTAGITPLVSVCVVLNQSMCVIQSGEQNCVILLGTRSKILKKSEPFEFSFDPRSKGKECRQRKICSGAGAEHINPGRGNCCGSPPVWMYFRITAELILILQDDCKCDIIYLYLKSGETSGSTVLKEETCWGSFTYVFLNIGHGSIWCYRVGSPKKFKLSFTRPHALPNP